MKREHPPLPIAWIDAIFARLTGAYGRRFMSLWDGLDVDTIKQGWAIDMGGTSPEAIAYALDHLPAVKAPDLPAFKALCREAPALPERAALPAPAADVDPALVRRVAESMSALRQTMRPGRDVRAECAARVAEKAARGERLTTYQRGFMAPAPSSPAAVVGAASGVEFPPGLPLPIPGKSEARP